MSYLVLARKWRPQTFTDLVGQEHVAQTLRNAIAQGRIAHAFLFTGARGVGKTTIARVLTKALNCLSSQSPTGEPCGTCSSCEEIARSVDVDVREIDGASNNSVEDVRRLQETLPYLPVRDRYKIVIIDEVHMLSTAAFNALLKTLEEPPAHVKFIFATTEVHKVPITILSRCQRYDFKLIPTARIRERLAYILKQEGLQFEDGAVALVAREAAGSLRDALSLLDQVIAASPDAVTTSSASQILGVADHTVLYELIRAVLQGQAAQALKTLQNVAKEGYDLAQFARALLSVLRDLVVARVVQDASDLLDLPDDERAELTALANAYDAMDLERLFAAWSRTTDEASRAQEPRWVLEMALIRLAHRPALVPIEDLLSRLQDLERRGGSGGGNDPRPSGGPPAPPRGTPAGQGGSHAAPANTSGVATTTSAPRPTLRAAAPTQQSAPVVRASSQAVATVQAPVTATATPTPTSLDLTKCTEMLDPWERVLQAAQSAPLAVLKHVVPVQVDASRIVIALEPGSFYARRVQGREVQDQIVAAAQLVFGQAPAFELLQIAVPDNAPTLARREEAKRTHERNVKEDAARAHPAVQRFLELVGGEIRAVRLDESGH